MRFFRKIICFILSITLISGIFTGCTEESDSPEKEELKVKNLTWAVCTVLPEADRFVEKMPSGYSVRFAEHYSFPSTGSYDLSLIFTDGAGREQTEAVRLTLISEVEPPVISGVSDIIVHIGEGVAYKSGITVSDNCDGDVVWNVDDSAVNLLAEGDYPIVYSARDAVGNESKKTAYVHVYREKITEDMLFEIIDAKITEAGIRRDMSREEQCRRIFSWVQNNVKFIDESDKNSWVRAAYTGLTNEPNMKGDCFTYFSIAKAFLDRLGIENMCIQRSKEATEYCKETHYWNYVNIGDAEHPRWYHFDTTHLKDGAKNCLLTLQQLRDYDNGRDKFAGYFYDFDASEYPASETTVITP